ncbi:MAG: polynucleotide adenylyltransferase PcnB [Gammaproteobacteria bacterium]|jgi:poly(A) polymerase|nr:polynucleotide adenylyltransferase PcnB [Gammaproteobacteria bacterium]MBT3859891.1 polynucleotide adenylyltransferase PcnB [Gammaproteobacteria bacterium]MBT3986353.1 polynucleotide adenylyltransferase PcnB [Gammaproteobacteria bacterium]MBT4254686.1 polynucleotide adenylyltransferase PcnB [Gammaproteobacteria bacterium]MBT4582913.1 polynucleotide adenylyltransferase PcnB [Gammaproteobacteria bacterium]
MKPQNSPPGIENAIRLSRDEHCISRKNISKNAVKVLYKLGEEGFNAYLVGGGVRDLLLGNQPKDFDIATDAEPEDIRRIFRNSRIIGRRFKIVHIRFGREIIEVTTFRAPHEALNEIADDAPRKRIKELDSAHSSSGMILRDNVYGNIDEDALRRDFTVNSLYYTVDNFEILDFSSGLNDIQSKQIRMIGDPEERYREDPVRMLRALRFSAKLKFEIEKETREPINRLAHLLESISSARLFDESMKLLTGGQAVDTFALLAEFDPGKYLFGPTIEAIEDAEAPASKLLQLALKNTDSRLAIGKSVTPAFLYAALLWPVLQKKINMQQSEEQNPGQIYSEAVSSCISEQLTFTSIPKRFTAASREIWDLQNRLERRNRRNVNSCFAHPRFRAAYDFLLLREESGENLGEAGQWWTDFQIGDTKQRDEMIEKLNSSNSRRKRRPRRKTNSDSH